MIVPLYQAELAHPSIRGRVTALQQFMLGIGALCAAWISWGCAVGFADDNEGQWRTSLGIQVLPAVLLAALILLFPESPVSTALYEVPRICLLTNCSVGSLITAGSRRV